MGINKDVLMGLHLHFTDFHWIENGFSWFVCYSGCFCYIEIMFAHFSFYSVGFFFFGGGCSLGKPSIFTLSEYTKTASFLSSLASFPFFLFSPSCLPSLPFLKAREEQFRTTISHLLPFTLGSYTLATAAQIPWHLFRFRGPFLRLGNLRKYRNQPADGTKTMVTVAMMSVMNIVIVRSSVQLF